MDELSPLFQEIEFHERFRGYDPDEVDAYVDRVAKAAALVQGRIAELSNRAESAESRLAESGGSEAEDTLRRTLVLAQRTADAAVAEAREQADRLVGDAEAKAQTTITMADARAEAQLRDAEDRSSRMLAEAETDRRQLLADAEAAATAAAQEARERLESDVQELARTRDFLRDDIEILERHLREQRARLVSSVATLSDLLEAPDALRVEPAPETSGVEPAALAPPVPPSESSSVPEVDSTPAVAPAAVFARFAEESPDVLDEPEIDDEPEAIVDEVPDPAVLDDAVLPHDVPADDPPPETAPEPDVTPVVDTAPEPEPVAESDDDVAEELIDLTTDPEPDRDTAPGVGGESGSVAPPRLVTAADVGQEPSASTVVDPGPATVPVPVMEAENSLFLDDAADDDDPFLAQLRDAVAGDERPVDEEAISAFFDDEDDDTDRSWFGRRR